MKNFMKLFKRFIVSAFILYGYNVIAVNFNMMVPFNIFTIAFTFILGAPGLFALVLFKLLLI